MDTPFTLEQLCPVVREAGVQQGDAWRQKPRRIYDYEFLYCYTGAARVRVGGEERRVTEGDLVIVPPDTPHTLSFEPTGIADFYWFHCDFMWHGDGDWVYMWYNTPEKYVRSFGAALPYPEHIRPELVLEGGFRLPRFLSFEQGDDVELLFRTLYKSYARADERFALNSKQVFMRLFERVLTTAGYWDAQTAPGKRVSEVVQRFIRYNYARKLSVEEICAGTRLNPDYAGKLFRRETGMSLIAYVNAYRVEKAKRLLLDESMSVAEIAERVGFQSESYFNGIVKRVSGMTPAKLRQYMKSLMEPME